MSDLTKAELVRENVRLKIENSKLRAELKGRGFLRKMMAFLF